MTKKGFTLVELLAIFALLTIIIMIAAPVVMGIVNSTKEDFRKGQLEAYAKEVEKAYMLTIAENSYYAFDDYSKGGITNNGIITFTNQWLNFNVEITGATIDCKNNIEEGNTDKTTLSKVSLAIDTNQVSLNDCVIDGKEGYNYSNGKVS